MSLPGAWRSFQEFQASDRGGRNHETSLDKTGTFGSRRSLLPGYATILGNPDTGPIVGGYLGAALLGAFFLSVGIFISGLFKEQILAFIMGMVSCVEGSQG